ncbi:CDP-diacylglycerol--glycerol-3-phosphate 3-phosphatidyltransferase [Anaerosalibacter bizertensis]|nr:CDP-diacylglycerol--glycerol-3-phosphate 3-phosphatidyltransferase [Anaerosalibacter bizertensis]
MIIIDKGLQNNRKGNYMNLANGLTLTRIFLIPIYLLFFYSTLEKRIVYAGIVLIVSGITDMLDGYVARKYNMVTKLGTVLDPIADKLTTFAVLASFTSYELISPWILIVLGIKELALIVGGGILYCSDDKKVIPANKFGKVATVSFYIAIISVILSLHQTAINTLFYITIFFHLLAFLNYLSIFKGVMADKDEA